jgi:hypothetical protein
MTADWLGGVLQAASRADAPTDQLVRELYPPKRRGRRRIPNADALWVAWRVRERTARLSAQDAFLTLVREFGDAANIGELDRAQASLDDLVKRIRDHGWHVPRGLERPRYIVAPQVATARRKAREDVQRAMFTRLEAIEPFVVDDPKPPPGLDAKGAGRLRKALADPTMQRLAAKLDPPSKTTARPRGRPRKHAQLQPEPESIAALRAAGVPVGRSTPQPEPKPPWSTTTPADREIVEAVLRFGAAHDRG